MADSIQNRKTQQTYLRQIQQEKADRKREVMNNQKEDIKNVRDFYADQSKQIDTESAAAVSHINEESRQLAAAQRQQHAEQAQFEAQQKRDKLEESNSARSKNVQEASSTTEPDKKKTSIPVKHL